VNPEVAEASSETGHPPATDRLRNGLFVALHWFELGLAVCTALVVMAGAVCLFALLARQGIPSTLSEFSTSFEDVLSSLLLLVVGVSLAVMLLLRRPESVVDIMFFVVARKILITTRQIHELLFAVGAIAGLFAVKRYLMPADKKLPKMGKEL